MAGGLSGGAGDVVDLRAATATEFDPDPDGKIVCDDGLLAWIAEWDSSATRLFTHAATEADVVRGAEGVSSDSGPYASNDLQVATDGYLWDNAWEEVTGPDQWTTHALDRTGSVRASAPGRLITVSDEYLVVATSDEDGGGDPFAVYKITRE